jgi:hypothetical protein
MCISNLILAIHTQIVNGLEEPFSKTAEKVPPAHAQWVLIQNEEVSALGQFHQSTVKSGDWKDKTHNCGILQITGGLPSPTRIKLEEPSRAAYRFDTGSLASIGIDTILVLVGWYFGRYFEH